jgi:hypothetical protein
MVDDPYCEVPKDFLSRWPDRDLARRIAQVGRPRDPEQLEAAFALQDFLRARATPLLPSAEVLAQESFRHRTLALMQQRTGVGA